MIIACIPARWSSTRFPGKPLIQLAGKSMIQHVWERCKKAQLVDEVVIATDDDRIHRAATSFGAKVVMTDPKHESGTDRIYEACQTFSQMTHVINVQGDEPLISPLLIDQLAKTLKENEKVEMITAAAPLKDIEMRNDPNVVKVILNTLGEAIYFSRSCIPYPRQEVGANYLRHLGIYGYQKTFLQKFVQWEPSLLERTESLEQLRAVERGVRIKVEITNESTPGVDTPEQAKMIEKILLEQEIK
jgi:3-deoxy-manno-octulosonate cytidylyltransferase (CMP-KDO synthetase)